MQVCEQVEGQVGRWRTQHLAALVQAASELWLLEAVCAGTLANRWHASAPPACSPRAAAGPALHAGSRHLQVKGLFRRGRWGMAHAVLPACDLGKLRGDCIDRCACAVG